MHSIHINGVLVYFNIDKNIITMFFINDKFKCIKLVDMKLEIYNLSQNLKTQIYPGLHKLGEIIATDRLWINNIEVEKRDVYLNFNFAREAYNDELKKINIEYSIITKGITIRYGIHTIETNIMKFE